MAAFSSAAAEVTSEGPIADVVAAMAVTLATLETDDNINAQVVLLPNGLFQGVILHGVV